MTQTWQIYLKIVQKNPPTVMQCRGKYLDEKKLFFLRHLSCKRWDAGNIHPRNQ